MGRTSDAKARLLESAMELMYARGYTAVGVQEICEHAGVNKGSFYYFFPSKRTLALEVIDAYGQHVRDMWQDAMAADGPLLERLQRYLSMPTIPIAPSWRPMDRCTAALSGTSSSS